MVDLARYLRHSQKQWDSKHSLVVGEMLEHQSVIAENITVV